MKRKVALALLALVLVLSMVTAVACKPQETPSESYKITIAETTNGTITADKQTAKEGETVTLTVTPDEGYILKSGSLKFNDTAIEGTTFKMPNKDVTITAEFAKDMTGVTVESIEKDGLKMSATQLSKTATAYLFTTFGETALTFTAFVEDGTLKDGDGMKVMFASEQEIVNAVLPDGKTISIEITHDGNKLIQTTDEEGKFVDLTEGATATFELWSEDGNDVDGYKIVMTVDYAKLGLTKDTAKNSITFCPLLYNASSNIAPSRGYINNVMDENKANTYMVVVNDNQYRANAYESGTGQLGSVSYLAHGQYWDLSQDYYKSNPDYANRKAVLTGHDSADNNLMFYRTSSELMYAQATIKVTSFTDPNEAWGKFGMMLFDGQSKTGLFYYVDAFASQPGNIDSIGGTAVGTNKGVVDWGAWNTVKNGVFNLETKTITLAMVYQGGYIYLYADNVKVGSVYYGDYNENMYFGLKSFGYGLEVTNYFASSDPVADGWEDKLETIEKKDVDTLFIGDSYMEFWKASGFTSHVAQLPSYANEGIGGTKTTNWMSKLQDMSARYNPSNIVMHIGVNDIDDEGLSKEEATARLLELFNAYHEAFGEAQLYWVALIPNTMFADKVATYKEVNAEIKAFAENNGWLTYIEADKAFTTESGGARVNMFYDGLHLNREFGYPLWAKVIMEALGYTHEQGTELGDGTNFAYSDGWKFIEDGKKAYNASNGEQVVWMQNASGSDIYAEFSATIGKVYENDAFPKFGAYLRNDEVSILGYVDAAGLALGAGGKGSNIVYRPNRVTDGGFAVAGDWQWGTQPGGSQITGEYTNGSYVKVAIAKLGNQIVLWVNDVLVSKTTASYIDATDVVTVGFGGFNLEMTVQGLYVTTDVEEITEKVEGTKATDAVIDGVADDAIYTEQVLGYTSSFGMQKDGKTHFTLSGVKGTDGVYFIATIIAPENTRNGPAWFEFANIEFRFGNNDSVQHYIYFDQPGFASVAASNGITQVASNGGKLIEDGEYTGMYEVVVEFFAPFTSFAGCDASTEEIPVKVWGWVYGEQGWTSAMNEGKWNAYTASEQGLRFQRNITVEGNNVAVTVTPSKTTAYKGETITLDVQLQEGQQIESIKVNGEAITAQDGIYSFTMPDEDVVIEVTLQGISVTTKTEMPEGTTGAKITASQGTASIGDTITFTVEFPSDVTLKSLTVNGEAIEITGGTYSYTVKEGDAKVEIIATFEYATEMTIDGVLDPEENYGEPVGFLVEGNRKVTIYAVKGENGVYFFVEAYTDTLINDNAAQWFMNHNFEFYLNNGGQCYVNSRSESVGVSKFVWESSQMDVGEFNGKYRHVAEIFVHKSLIQNFGEEIQLNYAFKAPNEVARWEGMSNNQWNRGDWWNSYIGGADGNIVGAFGQGNGRPANLFITAEGLVCKLPVPQNGTIDGDLTEFAEKTSVTVGNENAKFVVTGYTAQDGLYMAFTIKQKQLAEATNEWHLNDNLEFKVNGVACSFSLFDKFIAAFGSVTDYAMVRTEIDEDGYKYQTVVEMFIAMDNPSMATNIQLGCNGNGFGGWQSLIWDNNYAYVTTNGVAYAADVAALDGVTLDGTMDAGFEALETVSGSHKEEAVTLTGKKLQYGVVLYATINHSKAVGDVVQNDGTAWFHFLNVELRMGTNKWAQICSSVHNNYTQFCASAINTTGEGPYTTTFELYVPYGSMHGTDVASDIEIAMAVVTFDSWGLVFGTWDATTFRVTDNGVVNIA